MSQPFSCHQALADWDALATLLRGVCLTLEAQPSLHHLAHMKSLVNACISIVLEYGPGTESAIAERWNILPNHIFCSMVAKVAALNASVLGVSSFLCANATLCYTPYMFIIAKITGSEITLAFLLVGLYK